MALPWYINSSKRQIAVWSSFNNPREIKKLVPGELHLFLQVLKNGWRQIKFWDSDQWNLGWLRPGEKSFPLWFHLYRSGMFTTEAKVFNEQGILFLHKKTLFYFRMKTPLTVRDREGNRICSYPAGTVVAQDGYFSSPGDRVFVSHSYVGREDGFICYFAPRFLDLSCLDEVVLREG